MKAHHLQEVGKAERKPIYITNEWLSNSTVFMAMSDLLKGYYTHDVAYNLEKLSRKLNSAQKEFARDSEKIISKYTKHDQTGQPLRKMEPAVDHEGKPIFDAQGVQKQVAVDFEWLEKVEAKNSLGETVTDSGKELAEIAFKDLGEKEIDLGIFKFNRFDFRDAKLTVAQWMSLKPIFDNSLEDEAPFSNE